MPWPALAVPTAQVTQRLSAGVAFLARLLLVPVRTHALRRQRWFRCWAGLDHCGLRLCRLRHLGIVRPLAMSPTQ